jgi:predicted small metal-binding protein
MHKYCLECDWRASTDDGDTEQEVSRKAIEHFVETGHTVDSIRLPPSCVNKN